MEANSHGIKGPRQEIAFDGGYNRYLERLASGAGPRRAVGRESWWQGPDHVSQPPIGLLLEELCAEVQLLGRRRHQDVDSAKENGQ